MAAKLFLELLLVGDSAQQFAWEQVRMGDLCTRKACAAFFKIQMRRGGCRHSASVYKGGGSDQDPQPPWPQPQE
jgi:hypothetical protein